MAEEAISLPISDQNIEHHLVTIFEKLENLRNDNLNSQCTPNKLPVQVEIRTLEFWRAVISECLASFIYVLVVCGAAAGAVGASTPQQLLATALAAGFAMTSITHCFGHISGAHVNPAVSIAMGMTKNISLLRMTLFIVSQCGGAIAGAAFLYGVTLPAYQATFVHVAVEAPWPKFGLEFILTFVVVFSYFVSMNGHRKWTGTSAITIGATYSACSFVSMPYLNPARSLGPSFVHNKWDNHWVYWIGPLLGGIVAGLVYEYIFNAKRHKRPRDSTDGDSSSIHSDEDTYDDLDKAAAPKFHGSTYNTYRSAGGTGGPSGYCPSLTSASLYSAPASKLERVESLYGGTKSLYCKSPPLTRANLNRSQSVYTKSNSAVHRDIIPKPGPLVPAQSLYPIRLNQQNHAQNQNLQNQLHQRSESIYGVRGVTPGTARTENYSGIPAERALYSTTRTNNQEESGKTISNRGNRPESMYGMLSSQARRGQSAQSDDSSYGSYHGPSPRTNPSTYHHINNIPSFQSNKNSTGGAPYNRGASGEGGRPPPPSNPLLSTGSASSYHHNHEH